MVPTFQDAARRAFDDLAFENGLAFSSSSEGEVRYENDSLSVRVVYDHGRSFEIDVFFQSRKPFEEEQELALSSVVPTEICGAGGWMAGPDKNLAVALEEIAGHVRTYASDLLRDDELAFRRASRSSNRRNTEYALARDLRAARREAESAWQKRDFAKVVSVFEPLSEHLSPAELHRLRYSKKHCSG